MRGSGHLANGFSWLGKSIIALLLLASYLILYCFAILSNLLDNLPSLGCRRRSWV